MTTASIDVSVVVCTYSQARWDQLVGAVESLKCQTLKPREIIVVVDHNADLEGRIREEFPDLYVVENSERRGLSGSRNSGIASAGGEIIAFIDDDAIASPDWISQLHAGYEDDRVMGVGGSALPVWDKGKPCWFPDEFNWVIGCTYRGMPSKAGPIRNLMGCNMSFRHGTLDTLGGFRSGIGRVGRHPVGCEETELCIRARQHWKQGIILYKPEALVFHRVLADRGTWRYFLRRSFAEGVSKARIGRFVGTEDALATEATYTLRTLPSGIASGLMAPLKQFDLCGLSRAVAICVGLATTAMGYFFDRICGGFSTRAIRERLRKRG